jgi:hypothetical protein
MSMSTGRNGHKRTEGEGMDPLSIKKPPDEGLPLILRPLLKLSFS